MSKELKIAKILVGVSSDYAIGNIGIEVFKMQVKFANEELNKLQPLQNDKYHDIKLKLKTQFSTTSRISEEIYLGDKLKVMEGSNCITSGIVYLDNKEFKVNGENLKDFLDCEWTVIRSGENELIRRLLK